MELVMKTALRRWLVARQFNPGLVGILINPFYLARRGLWREIREASDQLTGDILDVGCGTKPYRSLFNVRSYTGLEFDTPVARRRNMAEVYYDGGSFPFAAEKFDSVLCNQVLEHVFNPDEFLREISRVLKPGGRLLLTVPFIWDEHEQPYDYARYTSFGLRSMLERNGFRVSRQKKILSNASVLFQLLNAYLFKVMETRVVALKLALRVLVFAPISVLGLLAGFLLPKNSDMFLDQLVVAERLSVEERGNP
jgi:SAM-dependent methyltransferase